jgi:valyl-tRNA synthetase
MIFSGLEQMGKEPFKYVFIHGIVRDELGRKMSKSLGNGIDPLEVIEKYGTDALRFALTIGVSQGSDLRFSDKKVESSRNFTNKVWNASRFVLMNFDENIDFSKVSEEKFTVADKWILTRINNLAKEITENMEKFEVGIALQKVYEFIWEEFCDWYIELVKPRLYDKEHESRLEAQYVLNYTLGNALKLLHPFMPFLTEEIYCHLINDDESIMISKWPEYVEKYNYSEDEAKMQLIMEAVRSVRNIRAEMNVPPSRKAKIIFVASGDKELGILEEGKTYFEKLASASEVVVQRDKEGIPEDAVSSVIAGAEIFIPLDALIDIEKEIERLQKEKSNLEKELERVKGKLSNQGFVSKAPAKVIEEEKSKLMKYQEMYDKVVERLKALSK